MTEDIQKTYYFDWAATTPISDEVCRWLSHPVSYGNPGSVHLPGRRARKAVDKARRQVAESIGAKPEQMLFTSGGSEANNLMVLGLEKHLASIAKKHILVSAGEHESLYRAAHSLEDRGFLVTDIPLTRSGKIDMDEFGRLVKIDVGAVFVMCVNNETGAINPIKKIAQACRKHKALFGTDLVQTMGYLPINAREIGFDFATISSHKIYGPKGVGALYARDPSLLNPVIYGTQEGGLRGGTENVESIAGFGLACTRASFDPRRDGETEMFYKTQFYAQLLDELEDGGFNADRVHENGDPASFLFDCGKILNLRIDGIDGESLVLAADRLGLYISSGSACHAHSSDPSRVLLAMGLTPEEARQSIRISFSYAQPIEDVKEGASLLARAILSLDRINGLMINENIEIE